MIEMDSSGLTFRIRENAGRDEIFDPYRKRWVALTPEEWVRQSLLGYLVQRLGYPASLVAVERAVNLGERQRRFDAVIFNRQGKPGILIECKAPGEPIHDSAVSQLLAYQSVLGANFLLLTNGAMVRCWQVADETVVELAEFPLMQ